MRIRRILGAVVAVVAMAGGIFINQPAASADAVFVGGGAAPVTANLETEFEPLEDVDPVEVPLGLPAVVLPEEGSASEISASAIGRTVGPVSVFGLHATTIGNLRGNPYAHSTASIARLRIQASDIRAVASECTWDTNGRSAQTYIVKANGTKYAPAPNTVVPLLGVGTLVLNEQELSSVFDPATGGNFEVISVYGARLYLDIFNNDIDELRTSVSGHVGLAFSSCDPLNLPNLSGLKLQPNSDA